MGAKKIIDLLGGNLLSEVRKIVDNVVTTKEEKMKLQNELTRVENEFKEKYEHELTERLKADMSSDNFLSKNIRPFSLLFFILLMSIMVLGNGTGYLHIDNSYISTVKEIIMTMIAFYFGGRSAEKIINLKKK
jgi:hypothetical protein